MYLTKYCHVGADCIHGGHNRQLSKKCQATHQYTVTCAPGLEKILAQELRSESIGADKVEIGKGVVNFGPCDIDVALKANLYARTAFLVLQQIATLSTNCGVIQNHEVRDAINDVAWRELLPADCQLHVDCRGKYRGGLNQRNEMRNVIEYTIRDQMGLDRQYSDQASCSTSSTSTATDGSSSNYYNSGGAFSSSNGGAGDQQVVCLVQGDDSIGVYRNMSGMSLHKRGYRRAMHRAPLNECIAAGVLLMNGWPHNFNNGSVLLDPMCGSGTILVEAAQLAMAVPAGAGRSWWPFQEWPDLEDEVVKKDSIWKVLRKQAVEQAQQARNKKSLRAVGCDNHMASIKLSRASIIKAKAASVANVTLSACGQWNTSAKPSLVVVNPPWGVRDLQVWPEGANSSRQGEYGSSVLRDTWHELNDFLQNKCKGSRAVVLSGQHDIEQCLDMQDLSRHKLMIGGVDCRALSFTVPNGAVHVGQSGGKAGKSRGARRKARQGAQ